MQHEMINRTYIGDGVYAGHDSYQIWLVCSNGESDYNPIALDRGTFASLIHYAAKIYGSEFVKRETGRYQDKVED